MIPPRPATDDYAAKLENLIRRMVAQWDHSQPHGGWPDPVCVEDWHAHLVSRAKQLLRFLDQQRERGE